MRMIVTADWHAGGYNTHPDGVQGGINDIRASLKEMMDYAGKNHVRNIFVLGDIFKNRDPEMPYLEFTSEVFSSNPAVPFNWFIVLGNHDMQRVAGTPHALAVYKALALSNVRVIDTPMSVVVDGQEFACFPYHWAPQDQHLKEFVGHFNEKAILMGHGSIEGAFLNKFLDYEIYDDDTIRFDTVAKFPAVFFGHIHEFQHISHVWYPGSVQRLTYADEGVDKYFLDVTVEDGKVSVTPVQFTKTRKLLTVTYDQIKANEIPDLTNAIVRVMNVGRDDVEMVKGLLLARNPYHIYEVRTEEGQRQRIEKTDSIAKLGVGDFVRKFAERVGYKGDLKSAEQEIIRLITDQTA